MEKKQESDRWCYKVLNSPFLPSADPIEFLSVISWRWFFPSELKDLRKIHIQLPSSRIWRLRKRRKKLEWEKLLRFIHYWNAFQIPCSFTKNFWGDPKYSWKRIIKNKFGLYFNYIWMCLQTEPKLQNKN